MSHTSPVRSPKTARSPRRPRRPRNEDFQVHPTDLGSLFAKRPLVWGEDEGDYDTLLSKVTAAIRPTDVIEAMWVKDITDLTWEAQRLRRIKAGLLQASGQCALEMFLEGLPQPGLIDGVQYDVHRLASGYMSGLKLAVTLVERVLAEHGSDADGMMALGLANRLSDFDMIERMIAGAEARRNRALSELDRRREAAARHSRLRATDVDDVS
ncbi:hypothetical protein DC522_22710 [Microvirga sp. KLBC 81]|uniref:hypothetical protein n=1 Tax=Microvirga sp. KLBC 81 TaxID=1862707 RepID=UPI000D5218EF|nr:hypothetical protein [Microvirga sp. KLBC 81]PVE22126.1 hypothetical protein DC522_22710 [Microvirga sp. KLBC 81]